MITKETKAKVMSPYIGQPLKCKYPFRAEKNSLDKDRKLILSAAIIADCVDGTFNFNQFELQLKPLSEITDEHAIEVAKLFTEYNESAFSEYIDYRESMIFDGKDYVTNGFQAKHSIKDICALTQLLQSQGYDLPHHLLNGQTLEQAGLAVYENKTK